MTTEAPGPPQPPVMDVAEVYRTLGRLEEGQVQLKEQLVRHEAHNERQFDRILGQLQEGLSQLKGQLVRHEALNERQFDRIDERFNRMDERFSRMDERFDRMDERFARVDERFGRLEGRIDRLLLVLFGIGATIIVGFGGIILQNALGG